MNPKDLLSREQIYAQIALGELPQEPLPPAQNPAGLVEITRAARITAQAYDTAYESGIRPPELSEFQRARLERARQEASAAHSSRKSKVPLILWKRLSAIAALLLLGAATLLLLQQPDSQTGGLAQNDTTELPYSGVRSSGDEKSPTPAATSALAQLLAPLGEIQTLQPLTFIWRVDPSANWELRLFRKGETAPLATAADARSPYPIERLLTTTEVLTAGEEYHWELVNPATSEVSAHGEFQFSRDAAAIATTDSAALRAAMDSAISAGRPSEALILLFSLHSSLATEDFIRLRGELENTLMKKN